MPALKELLQLVNDLKKSGASTSQVDSALRGFFPATMSPSMDDVAGLARRQDQVKRSSSFIDRNSREGSHTLADMFGLSGRERSVFPALNDPKESSRAEAWDVLATDPLATGEYAFRTETVRSGGETGLLLPEEFLRTSTMRASVQGAGHYVSFGPREWRGYRDEFLSPSSGENRLVGRKADKYLLDEVDPENIEASDLLPIIDPKFDEDPYMEIADSNMLPMAEKIYRRVFESNRLFKTLPEYLKWIDGVINELDPSTVYLKWIDGVIDELPREKAFEPVDPSTVSKHGLWPGERLHDLEQERNAVERMLSPESKELGTDIINSRTRTVKYRSLADFDYIADWDSYIKDQPVPVKKMAAPLSYGVHRFLRDAIREFDTDVDDIIMYGSAAYEDGVLKLDFNGLTKEIPIPDNSVKFDTAAFIKNKDIQYKKPPLPAYPEGFEKEMSSRPLDRNGAERVLDEDGLLPVRSWYYSDLYEVIVNMMENSMTENESRLISAKATTEIMRRLGLVGHKALPERYWDANALTTRQDDYGYVPHYIYRIFYDRLATAKQQSFDSMSGKGPFESRNAAFYDKVFLEELGEITGAQAREAPWNELGR